MADLKFTKAALERAYSKKPEVRTVVDKEGRPDGDFVWLPEAVVRKINPSHPIIQHLDKMRKSGVSAALKVTEGAGAELKKLLSKIGIVSSPTCSCNSRAKKMDEMGDDWCEKNIPTIVGWLQEEANSRRLPFNETAARLLVRLSIRRSRKRKARPASPPQ